VVSDPGPSGSSRPRLLRPEGTILVTGGAGFIGSHVVDRLVELGWRVRILDSLHPLAHAEATLPDYVNPGAEFVHGDVRDPGDVDRALDGVVVVSHQAAMVGLGPDFGDTPAYVAANDAGTATLLAALYRRGFRGRFVLASSMVVYGEGRYACGRHGQVRPGPRREEDLARGAFEPTCPRCGSPLVPRAVPESAALDPRNVYAATKLHQEHLALAFARETGAPVTALRYHNVYGPRMPRDTPYAGVAAIFRSSLESSRAPRVFEDGGQLRDFVHVLDVAEANVLALVGRRPAPGVHNVGSGHPTTVGAMAAALARAFGPDAPVPVVTGEYRLGDVRHVFASCSRAATRLGFRARVPFEAGVRGFATAPLRTPVSPSA